MSAVMEVRYYEREGRKFSIALHDSGVLGVNYRSATAFVTDRGKGKVDVKLLGGWRTRSKPTIEEAMELACDLLVERVRPVEAKSEASQTTAWFNKLPTIRASSQ